MSYRDLREFISALQEHHELRVVEGADWNLEIGTLTELNYERQGPALLFDRIKDHLPGYRLLCNALHTQRRAILALGLPADTDVHVALQDYDQRVATYRPVPPVQVSDGVCFQNVALGDDVDLQKFPAPLWHEHDGGRYLGTGCLVFMRDPDTGLMNFGTYRVMLHDRNTVGLYISPGHMGAIILRKYWSRGQSCPVAVSLGQEPILFLVSSPHFGEKRGLIKYEFAGHVGGAPVEVVHEEITGFPVPATAEALLVGDCPPPEVEAREEGPFGEWTGYYASGSRPEPVIKVKAVYHRDDPIVLGMPPLRYRRGVKDYALPTESAHLKERLERAGIENVLDVWLLAIPGVTVIQLRQAYPGHAMKAALTLAGEYMGRFVVVVDEDINPRDPDEVLWAIGTRCDPATTLTIVDGGQTSWLDPRIPPDQKRIGDLTSSRAIINACKPFHWIHEFPRTNLASRDLRQQTLEKWPDLFGL